jgi:[acyl-carrier-protein] S-malonyltransferase
MPHLRGGDWIYDQGEKLVDAKEASVYAENRPGHRPLSSYNLPQWVYHPGKANKRITIEKQEYFGLATDGSRNFQNWNVAHVAAYHDDLKLLSLATHEQCKEKSRFGMTPTHMSAMGQHVYGPSINVLYELVQLGVADPEQINQSEQTAWHIAQRMQKPQNLKKFEKVLLKGHKPDDYDLRKEYQLRLRGKFGRDDSELVEPVDLTCLMFPGQGSQFVGMMKTLKDLPAVAEMMAKANEILGYDIMDIMINGPEEKLELTKYCQPAMYISGLAAIEQLKIDDPTKVSDVKAVAGLSLGEYTALTVAGVFDFETGLKLVKARGEAMDFEATKADAPKQGMLSVAGLDEDKLNDCIREVMSARKGNYTLQIANYLFPKGFSVAGNSDCVDELKDKAEDAGALQAKVLKTAGAFHTPMMGGAKDHLMQKLYESRGSMQNPKCTVYMNTTGEAIGPDTSPDEIIQMLGDQLVSPVKWEQCMKKAIDDGMTEFFECGPNKQLKAMMKRIDGKMAENTFNVLA